MLGSPRNAKNRRGKIMGDFADWLKKVRRYDSLNFFHQRKLDLRKEIAALELEMFQKKAALAASEAAIKRFNDYVPTVSGDYQCPDCWLASGTHAALIPIPSNSNDDQFRCSNCSGHFEFSP
jgi:hypothetical protein